MAGIALSARSCSRVSAQVLEEYLWGSLRQRPTMI